MFFNSGIRGARARDGVGSVANRELFIQKKDPVPSITSWAIQGTDDTSLDPAGGQTVVVTGTGFASGLTGIVGSTTLASVTVVSATTATFTSTAKSAGSYTLILSNASGAAAIYVPGITYSSIPTYTTAAGSIGSNYETTAINTQVVATSDSAITYSLATGALPSGATLYANGVITGTAPVDSSSTTYSFSIKATDAELQDVTRSFTLTINTDVVTWSSPGSGTTYTVVGNTPISNVTLSATSAAGYGVTYTANALPTGVTLSSGVISGTPTVESNITSLLTATASTTNRSATNTIYWVVTLNDQYFKYNSLLMSSTVVTNTFATDLSSNNLDITIVGDTKPSKFDPFELGYYSGYFDGTGDGLVINGNAGPIGTEDFTWECYAYISTMGGDYPRIFESNTGASGSFQVYLSGGTLTVGGNGTGTITSYSIASLTNQWLHLCITRTGSAMRIFVNGVLRAYSASGGNNFPSGGSAWRTINEGGGIIGYLSNMRVVRGSIVSAYSTSSTTTGTTIFTPPTSPLTAIAGTQFLGMQSSGFVDTSANAFAITVNGNTAVNPFQPFTPNSSYATYGSTYFDGTGDYLTVPDNGALQLATVTPFTIEAWIYPTDLSAADHGIIGKRAAGNEWQFNIHPSFGYLNFWNGSTTYQSNITLIVNTWYHVAVTWDATTLRFFVNGAMGSTYTGFTVSSSTNQVIIGGTGPTSSGPFTGYISNLRLVKGTAVYTSAFTPPTTPLTAITNTSLLTCQTTVPQTTSVFVDESGQNNSITRNGNTNIGTFSPLNGSWSNYFDGTGDYLQTPSSAFSLGTVFTVEAWVYPTISPTNAIVFSSTSSGELSLGYYSNTGFGVAASGVSWLLYSGTMPVVGAWNHIAVVRAGLGTNQTSIYINGTRVVNGTISNAFTGSGAWRVGFDGGGGGASWTGYISNLRVVAGTDVYGYTNTTITPSTTPLNSIANTKLLTCNSPSFVDYSPVNNVITKNGDTAVNKFSPFSGYITNFASYSGYFDGTGDYLDVPSNAAFTLGTGDFTIEGWMYMNSVTTGTLYDSRTGTTTVSPVIYLNSGVLTYFVATNVITGATLVSGQWYHIAVVRNSGSTKMYLNGTQTGSTYTDTNNYVIGGPKIGAGYGNANLLTGYISNLRVVKGTAVYTSTFTPPTVPLTAIANTSLLTCQSTTFIDNSVNAFAITVAGDAKPMIQNPFANTFTSPVAYSPTATGSSMYFDGTGDYLATTGSTAYTFGTGDFTVELWVYLTTLGSSYRQFAGTATSAAGFAFGLGGSNKLYITTSTNGTESSGTALVAGQWYHCAWTRSSGTVRMFLNGVLDNTTAGLTTNITETGGLIGGQASNYFMNGYISNHRVVKGTALYTNSFVPSNSPLPAVQNTVLLVSSTITPSVYDAAEINDIENVGNSKLTASNSPYYSSYSGQFDGSGDYLTFTNTTSQGVNFGTGDFTVELWYYMTNNTTNSTYHTFIRQDTTSGAFDFGYRPSATQLVLGRNATGEVTASVTLVLNTWNHIAVSRSGTNLRFFVNGSQVGSTITNSYDFSVTGGTVRIGSSNFDGTHTVYGYISNLRCARSAVYTSNFSVSTTPLTAIANTSLLTCQSNRFIDNSTNTFTVTKFGDTKISAFQPFGGSNLTKYSSVYFDGTGDYLNMLQNPVFALRSDYTIEAWVYRTDSGVQRAIVDLRGGSNLNVLFYMNTSNQLIAFNSTSSWITSTGTVPLNQWAHVAISRSGTSVKLFINGVNDGTATNSDLNVSVGPAYIGRQFGSTSSDWMGYISDVRITNGYARYTTTFTPPTVPLLGF